MNKPLTIALILAVLLLSALCILPEAHATTNLDNFTSNANWTVPYGVTTIVVEAWGGGGAGGGGTTGKNGGGGGAGGQYAKKNITVSIGQNYTIVVAGMALGTSQASGPAGGNTTFNSTTVVAVGGGGGIAGAGGAGATGSSVGGQGTTVYPGGNGANGVAGASSGGGGGGAGTTGSGGNASGTTAGIGNLSLGGNGGTGTTSSNGAGGIGSNYSGGGAGAAGNGLPGSGGAGYLRISYDAPPNTAPNITTPVIVPSSPNASSNLISNATAGDLESTNLVVEWYWYNGTSLKFGGNTSVTKGANSQITTLGSGNLTVNNVWNCTVRTFDGTTYSSFNSSKVTIQNTAPNITTPVITPASPNTSSNLVCNATAGDLENTSLVVEWSWYRNGNINLSGNTSVTKNANSQIITLGSGNLTVGDEWNCTVRTFDGTTYSAFDSVKVTVQNLEPNITVPVIAPTTPNSTSNLVCNATASDFENTSLRVEWYWFNGTAEKFRGNTTVTSGVNSEIATVGPGNLSVGAVWNCTVRAFDGWNYSSNISSKVTVQNTAPNITAPAITPTTPNATSNLVCNATAGDLENTSLVVEWYWYNGTVQKFGGNISVTKNANSQIITLGAGNLTVNDVWNCTVRTFDGTTYSSFDSSKITIQNTAPNITTPVIMPASPDTSSNLVCNATAGDLENTSLVVEWYWYKNGFQNISGNTSVTKNANSQIITLGAGNLTGNDEWNCTVRTFDGSLYSSFASSKVTITAGNSPPNITTPIIAPSLPNVTSNLICNVTAGDLENTSLVVEWYWYRNGVYNNSGNTSVTKDTTWQLSTIGAGNLTAGDSWNCTARTFDGTSYSAFDSSKVTIQNSAPNITALTIVPPSPNITSNLICNATAGDFENTSIMVEWYWYKNGFQNISGNTSVTKNANSQISTVGPGNLTRGDTWNCTVRAFDGITYSSFDSSTVTVQNLVPNITAPAIAPSSPNMTSTLICNATAGDAENTSLVVEWYWYNGTVQKFGGNTSVTKNSNREISTLGAGNLTVTDVWNCTARTFDGTTYSAFDSVKVTVQNTAPNITTPIILPASPNVSSNLVCNATAGDLENISLVVEWYWYKNTVLNLSGNTSVTKDTAWQLSTIGAGNLTLNDVWNCTARAFDGSSYSAFASSKVTIAAGNSAPNITAPVIYPSLLRANIDAYANLTYTDQNSDPGTVYFSWYVNNINVFNQTFASVASGTALRSNLSKSNYSKGSLINVSAYASDYSLSSGLFWSAVKNVSPVGSSYSSFNGATTDFDSLNDTENANQPIVEKTGSGKIVWKGSGLNVSGADFDTYLTISHNYIYVNIANLHSSLNSSANLTLYSLSYQYAPALYRDGTICGSYCTLVSYSSGTLKFNVSGFSGYSSGVNSNLTIWDETDQGMQYAGLSKYVNSSISFFANYTNSTSGAPVTGGGTACTINFSGGGAAMSYNATKLLYEYNRSFAAEGTYTFNITCDGSSLSYEPLNTSDSLSLSNYTAPQKYWNGSYSTSGGVVGQWNLSMAAGAAWFFPVSLATARNFTLISADTPPTITSLILTPTSPSHSSDLTCNATASDAENTSLAVEFWWYNLTGSGYVEVSHGNTSVTRNVNSLITTLGAGNTTAGETWNCTVRAFDGTQYSSFNSTTATIQNTLPQKVILMEPTNSNDTLLNRRPLFIWYNATDIDNDTLTYNISITHPVYADINVSGIATANFTPSSGLELDTAYNWTVRACDQAGCGPWSDSWNFSIMSVSIIVINGSVEFGILQPNDVRDTTNDSDPLSAKPFVIENNGNINVNVSVYAQNNMPLWVSSNAGLNTSYYQSKADNTSEIGSFDMALSLLDWANIMNETYRVSHIINLSYMDTKDTAQIEIKIRVPSGELPGTRTSTLVFEAGATT